MKIVMNNANPIFGRFLSHRLQLDGNEVCQVENDSEMIQTVCENCFDLIIFLSIRLCISDTCPIRTLVQRGKVVVLSTVYDEKAVMEAYKIGIKMYMTLPVDPSRLIRKVRGLWFDTGKCGG